MVTHEHEIWVSIVLPSHQHYLFIAEFSYVYISGSQPFLFEGHLFFFGGHGGPQGYYFLHSPPLLSPIFQQLGGLGERCKLPQRGRSPSWQRILEHSRAKSDRFWHVTRDFPAFKATRNFLIFLRISYFHHNEHSGSYPTGLPFQNGKFCSFAHIFLKFFRRSRATFWGLAGHFWPAGHRLGTTGIHNTISRAISMISRKTPLFAHASIPSAKRRVPS